MTPPPITLLPRPAPLEVDDVEEALRNLRAGHARDVENAGSTDVPGGAWTARITLLASARSDWQKQPAILRVWYPTQRCKTAQISVEDLERKSDRPVMIGLTDAAIERLAPKIHHFLVGQQEQICPIGYLYRSAVTALRYVADSWPGHGWQVQLTEERGWISARLLQYHPQVLAAIEEAERSGRDAYLHVRD